MRKFLIALAALLFASCQYPTAITEIVQPPAANVRIYDSAWDILAEARLEPSRAITSTVDLEAQVDAYNSAHTDDQRFLVFGEEVIPVESSPLARAYLVASDYAPIASYACPRSDLAAERETWRAEAQEQGALLYVDRDPPPYVPPHIVTDWERYALYVVDSSGSIIYEDHCTGWLAGGWDSIDQYFYSRRQAFQSVVDGAQGPNLPWRLIAGQLYP